MKANAKAQPNTMSTSSSTWGYKYLVAEIIMGFTFWSLINEYVATVWFFPLNRMSFTGMEIYLAFFFFVFLLGSQLLRSFFLSYAASVRVLAYSVGLLSFIPYDLKNPLFPFTFFNHKDPNAGRMPMVSFSVILGLFAIFRLWWSSNAERRYRSLWGFLLGLVVMMCVRLEYLTLNPVTVWTKPIFVNIIAVIWAGYTLGAEKWPVEEPQRASSPTSSSSILTGVSLGGLMFLTLMLFSSHGTMPRHLDLNPFPSGVWVILSVIGGIVASGKIHRIGTRQWFLVGLVGMSLFILGEDGESGPLSILGLVGGCIFGVYTISIWATVVQNFANTSRPGVALFFQSLVFLIFIFWSVWTVAYKFVPWWLGSLLLRERNRTLLLALLLTSSASFVEWTGAKGKPKDEPKKSRGMAPGVAERLPPKRVLLALAVIALSLFVPATVHRAIRAPADVKPLTDTKPTPINGMIWNIHFGYDNFGRNNFEDVAEAIRERDINVVGLLESDLTRIITGNRDFMEFLEAMANMVRTQPLPVIILSYITDRPRSKNYWVLIDSGLKDTTDQMNRYCEYIFYKDLKLEKFSRWDGGTLSDTEAQYATWTLPQ